MTLGANIRALRTRRKLQQAQLADRIGVAQSTVCDWESGKTQPRLERLSHIAKALGVTVARLVA